MSSSQDDIECPNCYGDECHRETSNNPFDRVELMCIDCGFYTNTQIFQMPLDEINERRETNNVGLPKDAENWLYPLTEKPKFHEERF